jgi:hypothetical protein
MADRDPGVGRLLDLAGEFARAGGTVQALPAISEALPWPQRRDAIRAQVAGLREALGLPEDGVPPDGRGYTHRERAMSAAVDCIDNMKHGFLARTDGRIVGVAACTWPREGLFQLEWLGSKAGNRGAGAALIAAVVESWPHASSLRLQSAFDSHPYYLRLGFQAESSDKLVLPAQRAAAVRDGMLRMRGHAMRDDRGL